MASSPPATATVKRAEKAELEKVFRKYASVEKDGEWYMSHGDFVCRYLQMVDSECPPETLRLLADVADTTKNKLISFVEFRTFETLLCTPDSVNQLAFKLFDVDNKGQISFDNFKKVLGATTVHAAIPFDFTSSYISTYFGTDRQHRLDYFEFSQLLQSLPTEHARQAFASVDEDHSGTIPALEFVALMKNIRGFRMSAYVQENLLSVAGGSPPRNVSYAHFKAFNQLLGNLNIMETIVHSATELDPAGRVTHIQVLRAAQHYAQVTPLQVSLLFGLCSVQEGSGYITTDDFKRMLPHSHSLRPHSVASHTVALTPSQEKSRSEVSLALRVFEPMYRFILGAMAGATGATAVYPIDLVKTRLQNQRGSIAGEIMYKNSFDCFTKVVRNEGVIGLYRGLLPQLVGVAPEKAIKLTMNDTMRDVLRNSDGSLPLWKECIAGGCGGGSQVTFTNPLEIVKIRLQVAGEMAQTARLGAYQVVKELGFMGLYKGASACFMRDIPFSAIYFPCYAHMKTFTANKDGKNGPTSLFVSGFTAGVPAAGLLTPADVIKTRLQVKARAGQQTYTGIADCFRKIMANEGPRAFWKGAPARIFRSSPQFGVTLLTYELLQRLFHIDFGHGPPTTSAAASTPRDSAPFHLPDHIGGFQSAHSTFAGVESRFGLIFPRFPSQSPSNTSHTSS